MNERILKLASSCFPRDTDGNINATTEMIAEFAELIVRECISNLEFHGHDAAVDQLEWFRRKHFGVE